MQNQKSVLADINRPLAMVNERQEKIKSAMANFKFEYSLMSYDAKQDKEYLKSTLYKWLNANNIANEVTIGETLFMIDIIKAEVTYGK